MPGAPHFAEFFGAGDDVFGGGVGEHGVIALHAPNVPEQNRRVLYHNFYSIPTPQC